jgi:putative ABC transport system ATP-binding protein
MVRANPLLEARGVRRSFGKDLVLHEASLSIRAGESVSITGHSGSGKTTLLSILALLLQPDVGEIWVAGSNTTHLTDRERSRLRNQFFGYVFQAAHLVGSLSVLDNVLVPALIAGRGRERRDYARSLLVSLGLNNRESHLPHMLSLGQRRRVALARALVLEPPLILADEPTNDLDPRRANQIAEFLLGLPARGHALVLVTHDRALAGAADIRLFLRDGVLGNAEGVGETMLAQKSVLSAIHEFDQRSLGRGTNKQS